MLHPPLPEKIWFYPIDHASNTGTFQALDSNYKVKIPLHPFLGCIGVAPANGEARSSIVPAEFGGNMDAPEVSAGNTLYLPVNVSGGLFYFGDGHAVMGDGRNRGHSHRSAHDGAVTARPCEREAHKIGRASRTKKNHGRGNLPSGG